VRPDCVAVFPLIGTGHIGPGPGCVDRARPRALRGYAPLPPPGLTRPGHGYADGGHDPGTGPVAAGAETNRFTTAESQ